MATVDKIPGFIARSDLLKSLWENGSVAFSSDPTVTSEQKWEAAARFVAGFAAGAAAGMAVTTSTSLIRLGLAISGKSWEARMLPVLGGVYGGITGTRRVIEYFLSPLIQYSSESLRER